MPVNSTKVSNVSHLWGIFCTVPQSQCYCTAPSSQNKTCSEICDPVFNRNWGTGSKFLLLLFATAILLFSASCSTKKTVRASVGNYGSGGAVFIDPSLDGVRRDLVAEASTWIGTPYRYGGHDRRGTDCSGLVMEVYRSVTGKKLPRTTVEQNAGCKRIKRKELRAGDLVFFGSPKGGSKVSHVGMYIGDDRMIHASSSRGVMVSRIDDKYFGPRFRNAGRVPGIKDKERRSQVPPPVEIVTPPEKVPEITLDQLDLILQEKVDSISNSLLFD